MPQPPKLTARQRADIRRRLEAAEAAKKYAAAVKQLAAEYGVSTSTIRNCR